jgi:ribosomal-protein-alanine N-acetyltransferase
LTAITKKDIDLILEIENDSFKKPWSRLSFVNEFACQDARIYVVKCRDVNGDEQLIGYICFRLTAGEMHILKLAVALRWREFGVASRLVRKSLDMALEKNILNAFLEVRPTNYPAINFYRKIGFKIVGRRKHYYPETKEDALVMVKNLKIDCIPTAEKMCSQHGLRITTCIRNRDIIINRNFS